MTLAPGDRFGLYEVIELIGVGGMGEVYRVRDGQLQRDVALKVLPDARRFDPEALQRFEREARLLASLNHPNVATLHGLETVGDARALVMELVDGETLDRRLARANGRGLPLKEALQIARQIADALDAAHERGVVHRDLKPSNIKVRSDGTVKVLDFGIAKAFDSDPNSRSGATVDVTRMPGAIIGTPSYMSPEQATGSVVDRRTDIWAFGCVLFELLTGQRAFAAETESGTLARVIEREPDWSKLPVGLPPGIRTLLQRCLTKDAKTRRRDSGDVRLDLDAMLAEPPGPTTAGTGASRPAERRSAWLSSTSVAALAAVALVAFWVGAREPPAQETVRFAVLAPDNSRFETPLGSGSGAPVGGNVSPDGRKLAFTARDDSGEVRLWVRALDSLDAQALPGTEDAALPFWSPDSESIGFFARSRLFRIDVTGGPPQELAEVVRGQGGTWNREGIILFAPDLRSGLRRMSAIGGESIQVTMLTNGQRAHRFPYFLPDGEHFLYYVEGAGPDDSGVFAASLNGESSRRLLAADSAAVYAHPNRLLFVRQGTLFSQAFDASFLETSAEPMRVAQSIAFEGSAPAFSVSATGVLTYRSGPADSDQQQFAWFDRAGNRLEAVGTPGTYRGVDLSPDGTRIAVHNHQGSGGDIWIFEPRGTTTRVTFDPAQDNASPIWSPDGSRIAFGSLRDGKWGLYQKLASGEGNDELLLESAIPKIPASWSPDGSGIVFWLYDPQAGVHLWLHPTTTAGSQPVRLIESLGYDGHGQVSPDGKWIAYMSIPAGRTEVFVRPFPSGGGVWQVSTGGGVTPRWRKDTKELYYITRYDHGKLMAVPVETAGDTFVPGASQELFGVDMAVVPHSTVVQNFHTYSVSPDGQRFLLPVPLSLLRSDGAAAIVVVLNWTTRLQE